jgi:hypothetical protein
MNAPKFKVKAHVTVPLLKVDDGKTYYVKFNGPIHRATVNEAEQKKYENARAKWDALDAAAKNDTENNPMPTPPNPPMLAQVIDLSSGEVAQIIVGSVLQSELQQAYPDHSYIGRGFQFVKAKIQGKRYSAYQIAELELEEEIDTTPQVEAKTADEKPASRAKK